MRAFIRRHPLRLAWGNNCSCSCTVPPFYKKSILAGFTQGARIRNSHIPYSRPEECGKLISRGAHSHCSGVAHRLPVAHTYHGIYTGQSRCHIPVPPIKARAWLSCRHAYLTTCLSVAPNIMETLGVFPVGYRGTRGTQQPTTRGRC